MNVIFQDLIEKLEWRKVETGDSRQRIYAITWYYTKNKTNVTFDKVSRKLSALLSSRENSWNSSQQEKLKV